MVFMCCLLFGLGNHSLYLSFDTYGPNMVLMEGTEQLDFDALVRGQVKYI